MKYNKFKKILFTPFSIPVFLFILVILTGTTLLHLDISTVKGDISWVDAFFTSVSATCVTGLGVVDTGTFFSLFGQVVILCLIQLGGLGIVTYTCLIFYLIGRKVSLRDRLSVTSSLMFDSSLNLKKFLMRVLFLTILIEAIGALLLHFARPESFSLFSAVFHSVSAFCNAGFSLFPDSLMRFKADSMVNSIFMVLIVAGGIGFSVLIELYFFIVASFIKRDRKHIQLSWYSKLVLKTTAFLIFFGFITIFLNRYFLNQYSSLDSLAVSSLFQSVTARTAGFNTLNLAGLSNEVLFCMIILMYIGAASGSCAGGIKVSTFRVITAFIRATLTGNSQTIIGRFAVDQKSVNRALILVVSSIFFIMCSLFILNITECRGLLLDHSRIKSFQLFFEAVSAFGTVGLTTGITSSLSVTGKLVICILMFIGRIGPVGLITAIQSYQKKSVVRRPEEDIMIG